MNRLIDADVFKEYIKNGFQDTTNLFKSEECRDVARQITEAFCRDIDEQPTAYDVRDKTINDSKVAVAKAICIGCGQLNETECIYSGQICRTSKPMLEVAMKALDKLKAGDS